MKSCQLEGTNLACGLQDVMAAPGGGHRPHLHHLLHLLSHHLHLQVQTPPGQGNHLPASFAMQADMHSSRHQLVPQGCTIDPITQRLFLLASASIIESIVDAQTLTVRESGLPSQPVGVEAHPMMGMARL